MWRSTSRGCIRRRGRASSAIDAPVGERRSPVTSAAGDLHLFDAETGARHRRTAGAARHERATCIIGIDAGTSVIKAVAFDLDGRADRRRRRCRTAMSTLPGGGVEQDMARTWARYRRGAARAGGARCRTWRAASSPRGHRPGRRHLADRQRRRAGGAGLAVARCARGRRSSDEFDAQRRTRAASTEHTGYGVNACKQSSAAGLAQAARARAARRAPPPPSTARTGSTSSSPASASPIPPRASSPSATSARAHYAPEVLDALGLRRCERLLPRDRRRQPRDTHAAHGEPRPPRPACPQGTPVVLGYRRRASAPASAAGSSSRGGAIGCSIVGSTGMHMRFVPDADAVQLNAEPQRLHHGVPGARQLCAQMQSNMAATLNIDWLLDSAREAGRAAGRRALDRERSARRHSMTRVLDGAGRRPRSIIPTSRGRRARAVRRRQRRARSSSGSRRRTRLRRPDARGL